MTQIRPTLGDHLQFRNGRAPSSRSDGGRFPIYGSNGFIGRSDSENAHAGAIVVGRVGSFCGSVHFSKGPCWVTDNAIVANPKTEDSPRFWYYALKHLDLNRHSQGSGQALLNQTVLSNISFTPPGTQARAAIAEVLGALDDKIAANRRAIEIGRALLLAEWQRATSGSTDIVFLEDIASINPRTPVASEPEPPYLDMKNLPEFGLLVSDWGSREPRGGARFQNGDSLLARITPCFENGKMAFVDFLEEGQVGYGSTEYIVLRPKPGIPAAVPYVISANPEFRAAAALLRTGTSGRQRVQGSELASSVIVIPDRESLCEFGKFSQALLKRLGAARTENQILASTRDELLPLLMSGRITVGAASSRVEEVV